MRSGPSPFLSSGLLTDVGRQRAGRVNQDAALALELPRGGLYAVADGMGGHAAGELAANLAVGTLSRVYLAGRSTPPQRLTEAMQAANLAVMRHAVGESVGMGTTLLALLIDRGAALIAHVGDSRAYLLRAGELTRLTEDHSWVAEQVRLGILTEEEARHHQWRSVVSNALGGEERVRLELFGLGLRAGDRLLLCSDGLSSVVEERHLASILGSSPAPDAAARRLIDAANDGGGPDNITAVVVDVLHHQPLPRYPLPERLPGGPEYADLLLGTHRSNSPLTYLLLTLVYFTLLGVMLSAQHRTLIALLGISAMLLATLTQRFWQGRRARPAGRVLGFRRARSRVKGGQAASPPSATDGEGQGGKRA